MESQEEPRRTVTLRQFLSDDNCWYVYDSEGKIIGHIYNMVLDHNNNQIGFCTQEISTELIV